MPNKQLIQRLREAFNLSESMVSDEKVLISTRDTMIRHGIELNMACEGFADVLKRELEKIGARMPKNFIRGRVDQ
ncbi:MAG: hypothetical protein KAJ55_03105 [Anaerolineales bacterium]|nr:hypothetical protein [Anaerolineales bacterium]MCK5603549.1 hypothetical protein [Candidatus Pacearchaeota archaeon]